MMKVCGRLARLDHALKLPQLQVDKSLPIGASFPCPLSRVAHLGADLVAALSGLDVDDLPHGGGLEGGGGGWRRLVLSGGGG